MDDNVKQIIEEYVGEISMRERMETQIDALRAFVDAEDISTAKGGYSHATISTETIRKIFGWLLCDEARNARIEKEAAEKAVVADA